jgi:16S rRNA (guanine527-N7)-methyltransferase
MSEFKKTLEQLMSSSKLGSNEEMLDLCERYYEFVVEANKRTNLTRIISADHAAKMHFFGAIQLLEFVDIPLGANVIDIGTGAGFPGVPLKIARRDFNMTLLDSAGKKTAFVQNTTEQIGLQVDVRNARAEETGDLRERFDVVVSRAVAALPILTELCIPFIKVGGIFCAWKGEKYDEELCNAQNAIAVLGCAATAVHNVGAGAIIVIQKNKTTPDIYPRRFAKIKSDPL